MGKSPRKFSKGISPSTGGKNLSSYMNSGFDLNEKSLRRRFSIAQSSSSDDEDEEDDDDDEDDDGDDDEPDDEKRRYSGNKSRKVHYVSDSHSDSSLTAVLDNGVSDKSSILFDDDKFINGKGRGKGKGKIQSHTVGRVSGKNVTKGKSIKNYGQQFYNNSDSDDAVSFMSEDQSVISDGNDDDDDDEDEEDDSSSDDSDVDFVKLQAQKKIRAMLPPEKKKRRNSGSVSKPKFGRRRSETALPEDINFKFEFNDNSENAIDDSDDFNDKPNDFLDNSDSNDDSNDDDDGHSDANGVNSSDDEEVNDNNDNDNNDDEHGLDDEDLGEEIKDGIILENALPEEEDLGEAIDDIPLPPDDNTNNLQLDLDFNIPVPQFNEEDINSDEDYEIDDNELLATLQADNDLEDFTNNNSAPKRNSIISIDEDEETFLKEEEKFLVNEFENNGFDDEGEINNFSKNSYDSDQDEDDYEDDFNDMVDFTMDLDKEEFRSGKKVSKIKRKGYDSDDDDDSYLWNYFFSSDNDSDSDGENLRNTKHKHKQNNDNPKSNDSQYLAIGVDQAQVNDENYDSGESTDIDSNIPTTNNSGLGSQKAKEVLSSKTADYRPPILGTWIAVESKPFSIIDGLSTRSLMSTTHNNYRPSMVRPFAKPRKSFVGTPHNEDSALGLDELLNISEMDYDDTNDVKIWRDFNNQKKRVPLGAFRNKSYLQNAVGHDAMASNVHYNHTSKTNSEYNQRRYSLSNHNRKIKKNSNNNSNVTPIPSKLKRRRASKVEAFNEGYRPTKSGLFSEQALLDVEEVLGDDNDIMALIKGL